jgi:hypothetical protein
LTTELPSGQVTNSNSEISSSMLDVHAPHESIHAWKGFFIHIATIVIGLLIAISLEQTVEFFHHREQRLSCWKTCVERLRNASISCQSTTQITLTA